MANSIPPHLYLSSRILYQICLYRVLELVAEAVYIRWICPSPVPLFHVSSYESEHPRLSLSTRSAPRVCRETPPLTLAVYREDASNIPIALLAQEYLTAEII